MVKLKNILGEILNFPSECLIHDLKIAYNELSFSNLTSPKEPSKDDVFIELSLLKNSKLLTTWLMARTEVHQVVILINEVVATTR